MKRVLSLALIAVAMFSSTGAQAQRGGGINATQAQLQSRIDRGIASGQINNQEAKELQRKMSRISAMESRMRGPGNRLNPAERAKLQQELSELNSDITRQMTDFEGRKHGFYPGRGGGNGWHHNH